MKHCDCCGKTFDPAEAFCPECGAPLNADEQADSSSTEETVATMGLLGLL